MNTEQLIREEAERRYPEELILKKSFPPDGVDKNYQSRIEFIVAATFGASLNRWVSVKDMLPTEDGNYFVYLSNGQGWQSEWYNNKWYGVDGSDVTHWMQIVKP